MNVNFYKAGHTLIAIAHVLSGKHVILVKRADNDFVVSLYWEGEPEWVNGRYFKSLALAMDHFAYSFKRQCEIEGVE